MTEVRETFRLRQLRDLLTASLPEAAQVVMAVLPFSEEIEASHFPHLCWDPVCILVRSEKCAVAISGVMDWGVFWYKVEHGTEPTPLGEGAFWGTIDRYESVVGWVTRQFALA